MPDLSKLTMNHFYYIAIPLAIMVAAVLVGKALDRALAAWLVSVFGTEDDDHALHDVFIKAVAGLPVNFCLGFGFFWIARFMALPAAAEKLLTCLIFTNIVYTISRTVARILGGIVEIKTQSSAAPGVKNTIITKCVKFAVYAMGVLTVLQYYDISITPFLTALGVGGMAIALGVQETLANIFSGFHLIISRQIRIGEFVKLASGEEGRISDITLRFTSLVTVAGNEIIIPNSKLAAAILTNYSRPLPNTVIGIPVGVAYGSDLEQVERVALATAKETLKELNLNEPAAPSVRFNALADSSINFNVFITTDAHFSQGLIRHTFIKNIVRRFREENINIPFPIRTIVTAS